MFVQIVQGKVSDAERMHEQLDKWMRDLAPGATGWLGSTCGVTDDGTCVCVVRFDTPEHAQQNSDRTEQGAWWSETSKLFSRGAEFLDSERVTVDMPGDPAKAHFVQIIEGRATDASAAMAMSMDNSDKWAEFRPDVLGSVAANFTGGRYAMEMFFTDEAEAREGEQKEPPAELKAQMDQMQAMAAEPPTFLDLRNPWMYGPR
ncbi:MAG TPA: hypothetical protein VM677_04250 [Actinokineospora sp.]|jgi:hypothetical protein|nr:hypothetical protein [Actinokineospora sp.]